MKKNGFSLLELLVVIFIIGLFASIVVSGFNEVRNRLALKRAANQLVQDLRKAQEMAMSSAELKEGEGCSLPLAAQGYGIYINTSTDNKSYKLYADTTSDAGWDCETYSGPGTECWEYYNSADCVVQTVYIQEKGVIVKEILNTTGGVPKTGINFKPPNPNIKIKWLRDDMDEVKIVLALETKLSETRTVVINRAGMAQIQQ